MPDRQKVWQVLRAAFVALRLCHVEN